MSKYDNAYELLQFFSDCQKGNIEWDDDGSYHVVEIDEEDVDSVVDYMSKNVTPTIAPDGKIVAEISQFKEQYDAPGVKFVPNTLDYRVLNYDVQDVFNDSLDIIVECPIAERMSSEAGAIYNVKNSRSKQVKPLQEALIKFIRTLPGTVLICGRLGSLDFALTHEYNKDRYYFHGLDDHVLSWMSHEVKQYKNFEEHFYPDGNRNYDYIIHLNGDLIGKGQVISVQLIGDNIVSFGKGSSFSYKGIPYPSIDGEGFYSLSMFIETVHVMANTIFLKGYEPCLAPIVEPNAQLYTYPVFCSVVSEKYTVGQIRDGKYMSLDYQVPDGYYFFEVGTNFIIAPLYVCSVKWFMNLMKKECKIKQWSSDPGTSGFSFYMDSMFDFGSVRTGELNYGVMNMSLYVSAVNLGKVDKKYRDMYDRQVRTFNYKEYRVQRYKDSDNLIRFGKVISKGKIYEYEDDKCELVSVFYSTMVRREGFFFFDNHKFKYRFMREHDNMIYGKRIT